jgi:hypothetical protein
MLFGYDLGVTGQFVTGNTVVQLSAAQLYADSGQCSVPVISRILHSCTQVVCHLSHLS